MGKRSSVIECAIRIAVKGLVTLFLAEPPPAEGYNRYLIDGIAYEPIPTSGPSTCLAIKCEDEKRVFEGKMIEFITA